ncbi:MAG TPA: HEPN domain-containing protein [Anaerolineales bacterium]|nr:HEPN domain-containing protein [Anaerolineales bacterium]
MSAANNVFEWVSYAEEDLIMAKTALKRSKPLTTASCFHSQQCAEKYFKAILVARNIEFPKTHDLLILNTLCANTGIITGFKITDLGRLSGYAVHTRYPGNQPTPAAAREALEIANTIRQFARIFLGLKK